MAHWQVNRTLLIVGEGRHEEAFLKHVKQFSGVCGRGEKITITNAHGKGALHVINWTVRQMKNKAYDRRAVLLDTDTDWTTEAAEIAQENDIQVFTSIPCFEAMLLRVIGKKPDSKRLKKQFAPFVNNEAGEAESYAAHFHLKSLVSARKREPTIDALLRLFGL